MTSQINFTATEPIFTDGATPQELVKSLLASKMMAYKFKILIPDDLIAELEEFTKRNSLSRIAFVEEEYANECCPRCLKAHAIRQSIDLGLDQASILFIESIFPGEVGHSGYYTDGDRLIKI